MWGPPLWSVSMVDLLWALPPHTTNQLRALKAHLLGGGVVYGKYVKDGVIAVASFQGGAVTSQPRASESGTLLNVTLAGTPDPSTLNDLERAILRFGQVYVTRDGFYHPVVPTIIEYHLVIKPLSRLDHDIENIKGSSLRESAPFG